MNAATSRLLVSLCLMVGGPAMADVVALTDNAFEDQDPHISGGMVVWEVFDGNDWEIYLYRTGLDYPGEFDRDGDVDCEDFHGSRATGEGMTAASPFGSAPAN